MAKKSFEEEVFEFIKVWDAKKIKGFLVDIYPLIELWDVADHDWLLDEISEEDAQNVRLLRTVYIISKIAADYSGTFALLNYKFKDLYLRMERAVTQEAEQNYSMK